MNEALRPEDRADDDQISVSSHDSLHSNRSKRSQSATRSLSLSPGKSVQSTTPVQSAQQSGVLTAGNASVSRYGRERKQPRRRFEDEQAEDAERRKTHNTATHVSPSPKTKDSGAALNNQNFVSIKPAFSVADVVWSKLGSFPWWPCMITFDPGFGLYYEVQGSQLRYHVQYYGDNRRAWVQANNVMLFEGVDAYFRHVSEEVAKCPGKRASIEKRYEIPAKSKIEWELAVRIAEVAMKDTREKRLENLSAGILTPPKALMQNFRPIQELEQPSVTMLPSASKRLLPMKRNNAEVKRSRTSDEQIRMRSRGRPPKQQQENSREGLDTGDNDSTWADVMIGRSGRTSAASNSSESSGPPLFQLKQETLQSQEQFATPRSPTPEDTEDDTETCDLLADVSSAPVCPVCYRLSDETREPLVICKGMCGETFHAACVGQNMSNSNNFVCRACDLGDHGCFLCGLPKDAELLQCSKVGCCKFYHLTCVQTTFFARRDPHKRSPHSFYCPLHTCLTCGSEERLSAIKGKLVQCIRCPNAYHAKDKCIPAGAQILSTKYIVCCEHIEQRTVVHEHVSWCYQCGKGGDLLTCEQCPAACHKRCLDVMPAASKAHHFLCADCEMGKLPVCGDVVWLKMACYRWWPAVILRPHLYKGLLGSKHALGKYLVLMLGTNSAFWTDRTHVFQFFEEDLDALRHHTSKYVRDKFRNALTDTKLALEAQREGRPYPESFRHIFVPEVDASLEDDTLGDLILANESEVDGDSSMTSMSELMVARVDKPDTRSPYDNDLHEVDARLDDSTRSVVATEDDDTASLEPAKDSCEQDYDDDLADTTASTTGSELQ